MKDVEESEGHDGGQSPDSRADRPVDEPSEREEMEIDLDDEASRLGSRSVTASRRFRWAFVLSFWTAAVVLTFLWDFWLMLLALLPPLFLLTRPVLLVSETFRCATSESAEEVSADFSGPLTPITAIWFAAADAVLAPAPEDGEDAVAVLQSSRRRSSIDRVLREVQLADGRLGVTIDGGGDPMVATSIEPRGDHTDVTIEARRGPVSALDLGAALLTARYTEAMLRRYGYEPTAVDREYELALDPLIPG